MQTPRLSTRSPACTISCVWCWARATAFPYLHWRVGTIGVQQQFCVRCVHKTLWWQSVDVLTRVREVRKGLTRWTCWLSRRSPRFNFSRRVTRFERAGDGDTTQAKGINQKRSVCPRKAEILAKLAVNAESIEEVFDVFLRSEYGAVFPNTDTTQSLNRAEGLQGGFLKRLLESCASITTRSVRG